MILVAIYFQKIRDRQTISSNTPQFISLSHEMITIKGIRARLKQINSVVGSSGWKYNCVGFTVLLTGSTLLTFRHC